MVYNGHRAPSHHAQQQQNGRFHQRVALDCCCEAARGLAVVEDTTPLGDVGLTRSFTRDEVTLGLRLTSAAMTATSNTCFKLCWVSAEHSIYDTAPIRRIIARPSASDTGLSPYWESSISNYNITMIKWSYLTNSLRWSRNYINLTCGRKCATCAGQSFKVSIAI